jgi:5-methylcytosine-specific restriction endonuclease McrA
MDSVSKQIPGVGSIVKQCEICGSPFKIKPSQLHRAHCCSKECSHKRRTKKIEVKCKNCGKPMMVAPSRAAHNRGLVCSKKCQYEKNSREFKSKDAVVFNCRNCGKKFCLTPSQVRKKGSGKYCTRQCRDQHRVKENHPMYLNGRSSERRGPNWQAQKRKAKQRDQYTCQHCLLTEKEEITKTSQPLHVHHIKPYRCCDNYLVANELDNLITLCSACHRIADAKLLHG